MSESHRQIDPHANPVVLFGQLFNQLCGERVSPDVAAQVACQLATHTEGREPVAVEPSAQPAKAGPCPPGTVPT